MDEYIFKKISVQKKDFYNKLKELLVAAGWKSISSNPTTDNDVFYSTGESRKQKLYFQMKPADTNDTNDITTSNGTIMSFRLIGKYTPGLPGVSGVFDRKVAVEPWRRAMIFYPYNVTSQDSVMDVYYHINKNRLIFNTDINSAANVYGNTVFIGTPDNNLIKETNGRGLILLVNQYFSTARVIATSSSFRDTPSSVLHPVLSNLAPTTLNSSNLTMISDLVYGDNSEGMRGVVDGIFVAKAGKIQHGDIISDDDKKYQIFYQPTPTQTSLGINFTSEYVLIRIK